MYSIFNNYYIIKPELVSLVLDSYRCNNDATESNHSAPKRLYYVSP